MSAEANRRAYLDALGIDVWTRREVVVGPVADVADTSADSSIAPEGLDWLPLRQKVAACTLCALHKSRTQTVFGVGSETARCMIIGEAPGAEEDRQGEPFVGRAGKLLDEMLRAIGLRAKRGLHRQCIEVPAAQQSGSNRRRSESLPRLPGAAD